MDNAYEKEVPLHTPDLDYLDDDDDHDHDGDDGDGDDDDDDGDTDGDGDGDDDEDEDEVDQIIEGLRRQAGEGAGRVMGRDRWPGFFHCHRHHHRHHHHHYFWHHHRHDDLQERKW